VVPEVPGYPHDLEEDAQVAGGLAVHIRPIRADDGERLVEFHSRLSDQSVFRRYFFLHLTLSAEEVVRLTHVDYRDRLALVAEHGGRIVGVGRYDRTPASDEAEVAFVVADEHQHRGIAPLLLRRLASAARANGIRVFIAQTLRENRAMLDVFRHSGYPVTLRSEYDTVHVRFPIDLPVR
jgi:GNAT superfamily N-acetyltransferase